MIKRELLKRRLMATAVTVMLLLLLGCSAQMPSGQTAEDCSNATVFEAGLPTVPSNVPSNASDLPAIEAPDLISPTGIQNSGTPTYVWKSVAASQFYCLEVRDEGDDIVLRQWYNASDLSAGGQCTVTPLQSLQGGDYTWRVQSWNCNDGKWSQEMQFSICTSAAYPDRATLVSPKDITGSKNPTFVWKAVAGCTQYCLKVANAKDLAHPLSNDCYDAEEVLSGDICSVTPVLDLAPGTYRWWIQTRNCKGEGPWSNFLSFMYQDRPPGICTPLLPNGLISVSSPRFVWTAASRAVQYHLQIENSTTMIFEDWFDASEVASGSRCSAILPIALPDDDALYSWRIRAENDAGDGPWSRYRDFETVCASKKGDLAAAGLNNSSLINPAMGGNLTV